MKRDLVYALRGLRQHPTFAVVAIASLALGIGLNTAIFNLLSAVLLQPLPVRDPSRLFSVFTSDHVNAGVLYNSYPNYKDYRDRNTVFSGLALYTPVQVMLTGSGLSGESTGQIVSGNYFDVLGVKPVLGRSFLPGEDLVPNAEAVVVISYAFWQHRLAGAKQAIGQSLELNHRRFTIVGVAPPDFHGASALVSSDFWAPLMMYPQIYSMADWVDHRKALLFSVVGRLRNGVERGQALQQMRTLAAQLAREYPADNEGRSIVLIPLSESVIQPDSRGGLILVGRVALGVSLLVLLIACANVANLLLVRAAGRRKEMALRLALGIGRGRLIRQLLTESALLSLAGALGALLIGRWGRNLIWDFRPPWMLSGDAVLHFDGKVLAFTLVTAVAATLLFGLAPALSASRANLATELRERRSPWARGGRRVHARTLLVMAQVALSVVALTGAGLFLRSLRAAQTIDPGYDSTHIAAMALNLKSRGWDSTGSRKYYEAAMERASALPGVSAATIGFNPPFTVYRARSLSIEGRETSAGPTPVVPVDLIAPGYFQALRIPLLRGREFTRNDSAGNPRVGIVNQAMARQLWGAQNPIGARLRFYGDDAPVEVIGIVRDVVSSSLTETPKMMLYVCLWQYPSPTANLWVRTSADPRGLLETLRRSVQSLDSQVLLSDEDTAEALGNEKLWAPRLGAVLFMSFGVLAALLTIVGLYGVISFSVGQRTRELGIRMALGAQPRTVLSQVLAEGMILVFWGVIMGLVAAITVAGILKNLLFGVSTRDPLTLCCVVAILLLTALAACALPALRATRVDPLAALRDE